MPKASNITPDATSALKGKLQLANHLGGTATAPTVVAIADSTTIVTPTIAQINNSSAPGVKLQLRTQTDNSNSISSATTAGVFMQMGWGQIVGSGGANTTDTVTFPTAYTTVLGVIAGVIDVKVTTAATSITNLTAGFGTGQISIVAEDITTSGFTPNLQRADGLTMSNSAYFGYSWIAWGV